MSNCLVTKLNGVVDNNELLKLGEVKTNFSAVNGSAFIVEKNDNDAIIYDANGNIVAQASANNFSYNFTSAGNFVVDFTNKYELRQLLVRAAGSDLDVDAFKYSNYQGGGTKYFEINCPGVTGHISSIKQFFEGGTLNRIRINNCDIVGSLADISDLANKASITEVNFNGAKNVGGSLQNLSAFTALTNLNISGSGISPSTMKEFLDGMAALRSSGTLSIAMGANYTDNNAGLTRADPNITFSGGSWSQTN